MGVCFVSVVLVKTNLSSSLYKIVIVFRVEITVIMSNKQVINFDK